MSREDYLYFVPKPERQPLRLAGILDAIQLDDPDDLRELRTIYRALREAGVRPETARGALVRSLYLGGNASRVYSVGPRKIPMREWSWG